MKRWTKGILIAAGVGVATLLVGSVSLYLAAGGDYVVPATVTQDDSLPAVELNDVRLHHKVVGPEDAPIVVVLHGGPGDDFRALLPLEPLSDQYRMVFYDQRGAGLSERVPSSKLTLDDYIGELDALIEHHGGGPVHLLGHSWGAMLASAYLGQHPQRVKSAILVEPGFLTPEASAVFMAHLASPQITGELIKHAAWSWFQSRHVSGPDEDAAMDFFMLHFMLDAPNDGHPLGVYFCDGDATTAHLPHWRFGSTASAAVQEAVSEAGTVAERGRRHLRGPSAARGGRLQHPHRPGAPADLPPTAVQERTPRGRRRGWPHPHWREAGGGAAHVPRLPRGGGGSGRPQSPLTPEATRMTEPPRHSPTMQ
jgi:proline iminopeptidase